MAAKQGYGAELSKYLDKRLDIRLNGDRKVAGILKGFDSFMNIVIDNAIELGETEETSR
jgi:small nuclear ribonucleoprotein G